MIRVEDFSKDTPGITIEDRIKNAEITTTLGKSKVVVKKSAIICEVHS